MAEAGTLSGPAVLLAAALSAALVLSPAAPTSALAVGSIQGTVQYTDGDPDQPIQMDADPICIGLRSGEEILTERIVVDRESQLANVLVYVKDGLESEPTLPAEPVVLDQRGCQFKPHVLAVMVGQTLVIRNSDPTLHNVHARPVFNDEFDLSQPFKDMETELTFDSVEVAIPFRCDSHPWMSAYVAVLANPFFAVSATDGSFTIEGLAPGEYTLEAWHEELGPQQLAVTVAAGEAARAEFSFAGG
jgi:plastocyanin